MTTPRRLPTAGPVVRMHRFGLRRDVVGGVYGVWNRGMPNESEICEANSRVFVVPTEVGVMRVGVVGVQEMVAIGRCEC